MKFKQGMALPAIIVVTALLGAAVFAALPTGAGLELQQLRYKHSTWWHWQQAVIHYFHKTGQWPDNLNDVRNELGLATEPSFIEGYSIPGGFRVRVTGISTNNEKPLVRVLNPYVKRNVPNSLDADLNPLTTESDVYSFAILRNMTTEMATEINMNSYQLSQASDIHVLNQVDTQRQLDVELIVAQQLRSTTLNYPSAVSVANFHTDSQADILESLTANIKAQYLRLDNYMKSR